METEAEKQLAKLVSMPTISSDITANDMALDYIEAYLAKRGMHCRRDRFAGHGTLLASTRADNLFTPTVLLAAHVDVVAGHEEQFTLRREDDKLYGRGVYDMKFSIAAYMQLVDDLKDRLEEYDFGVLVVADEETTDVGVKHLVEAGLRTRICILPDSTAPDWNIEQTAKGYWRFDLITRGKAAHGGRPWEGESASLKLIHALHELKGHFEGQNVRTDSLNIGQIHGGKAHNMVAAEMVAGVDIRYLSGKNLAEKKALVADICKKHDVSVREITVAPPVITDLSQPLIQQYLESVETITGKTPRRHISCAGTDAPYFQEGGISCIISCPDGGGHHAQKEWISRKSFLQFVPILHDYLGKTAHSAGRSDISNNKTPASVRHTLPVADKH